jgi:hypothetical protein
MKQGDRDGALACWKAISALTRLLFAEPSPAPAKYWLARSGLIDSAEVRLPMVEVSAELAALLDEEIERRRPQLLRGPERRAGADAGPARPGWRAEQCALADQQAIGQHRREAEHDRPHGERRHQQNVMRALGEFADRIFIVRDHCHSPR